jgi:hypothetical protein
VILGKILGLLSAVLGAAGTILLFFGSFAYEAPTVYMNEELLANMIKRNKRRQFQQRSGLILLLLSFVLAGFSVWFS